MGRIVGIDLGTSTSEVSVMVDGGPFIIPNERGSGITPSVVGVVDGRFIVGEDAAERQLLYPSDTAVEVKRKMGRKERIKLGSKFYRPEDLSAKLLVHLKACAENYLKEPVDRAVITVPAFFDNEQRRATMEAGTLAGLKVERIINEPTAAALTYGIDHIDDESLILVYDFGGGTFDVTLLEMFDGVLDVKASSGNNTLGGKEFDRRLIDYLCSKCMEEHKVDLKKDLYAMVKLREAAIACKVALSTQDEYVVSIPMITVAGGLPVGIEETITVKMFEEMIGDLVELTRKPIETVLNDSGHTREEIDIILLTGGSTKIPYIYRFVENLLGKAPATLLDPDLAVAMGAAVQAAIVDGEVDSQDGIMITDVSSYALGVQIRGEVHGDITDDCMSVIIPRNTTIPVTKKERYRTASDYQSSAEIKIYQGDNEYASKNVFLGSFHVGRFPPAKAGKEKLEVSFSYDLNGMLEVTATVVSTGAAGSVTIDTSAMDVSGLDIDNWESSKAARMFRSTIRKAEKLIKSKRLDPTDTSELEELLIILKEALILGNDEEELEEIEAEILDLLD